VPLQPIEIKSVAYPAHVTRSKIARSIQDLLVDIPRSDCQLKYQYYWMLIQFNKSIFSKSFASSKSSVPLIRCISVSSRHEGRIYGPTSEGEPGYTSQFAKEHKLSNVLYLSVPPALIYPHWIFDTMLSLTIVMHCHWGLEGVVLDYIHGDRAKKILQPLLLVLSSCAFAGLCHLNYLDVGFGKLVQNLFTQL